MRRRQERKEKRERTNSTRRERAQANLPVLAVALVLLTTVTTVSVALADGALGSADRDPADRRVADAVADRLVAADTSLTARANVLNESQLTELDADRLDALVPTARDAAIRVRVGDETLAERGRVTDGATVRRVVLVTNRTSEARTLDLSTATTTTLPRRTDRVRLDIQTGPQTTVQTVRANDRVVLHNESGVGSVDGASGVDGLDGVDDSGELSVRVSRYETTTLSFETAGEGNGNVTVTYYPARTTKTVVAVTADA